jgi:hypothetical protein
MYAGSAPESANFFTPLEGHDLPTLTHRLRKRHDGPQRGNSGSAHSDDSYPLRGRRCRAGKWYLVCSGNRTEQCNTQ